MNYYEIINETNKDIKEIEELSKLLDFTLNYLKLNDVEFNIIIVDNKKIKELNKTYRKIDKETDVISFALEDYEDIKLEHRLLGDIYISYDKAKTQSMEYGHALIRELGFLSIHGLLHLLGYDHIKKEDEKIMFEKQKEILDKYGLTR